MQSRRTANMVNRLSVYACTVTGFLCCAQARSQDNPNRAPSLKIESSDPNVAPEGRELIEAQKKEKQRLLKWERRLQHLAAREHSTIFSTYPIRSIHL